MKRRILLTGVLAAGAALTLATSSCMKKHQGPPPGMRSVAVQAVAAVRQDVPVLIDAFGTTENRMSVDLIPQVSGTLIKTLIRDGAVVTNGQPLFLIDPRDYEARVRQVEGMLEADRANLEMNRVLVERNKALLAKQLIAQTDFDVLETKLKATQAQLQMDEAALDLARLNLARCTITAPLSGVCSRRFMDDGNLASAGVTRLVNIRSYDPINVSCTVSEDYLALLRRAVAEGSARLELRPRDATNRIPGVLTFLDNTVNTQAGTIQLRGEAPNPDLALWAGQYVSVRIQAGVLSGVVMVPEGAVQIGKQGSYLFVVTAENKADLRPVRMGVRYEGLVQVMGGVEPGERVVVLGQLMLFPGAPVVDLALMEPGRQP